MRQRHRTLLITTILALATLLTSLLVQRQTALLPDVRAAAPRPTSPVVLPPDEAETPVGVPNTSSPVEAIATPTLGPEVPPPAPPRAGLLAQQRLFYEPNFYTAQIQAFLDAQPGPLKNFRATVGERDYAFADILSSQAIYFSVNPKVLLALIEQQSGLITNPSPTEEQIRFMLGYRGEEEKYAGWTEQLRWARREIQKAQREFANAPDLLYADQSKSPLPPGLPLADYAIMRVLAATTTPDALPGKLDQGDGSFVATYTRLFGDPRDPPQNWPAPSAPFLALPMDKPHTVTSFFDHEAPFLQPNGTIVTYRGDRSEQVSYDGHDGWDFAITPPEERVRAAADGTVVFVGNAADGCGTRSVVIDHGNGYRTLYWHLSSWSVKLGPIKQGDEVGIPGSSGCVTGPHLHFGVQYLGRGTDPAGWCGPNGADPWANHAAGQTSRWLWRDVPSPCELPANTIVVDTTDPGFTRVGDGWQEAALGLGGTALYLPSALPNTSQLRIGVWRPKLPKAGKYRVLVWIPYILSDLKDAGALQYVVGNADGSGDTRQVTVSQWDTGNWWADLGTYTFDPARNPFVGLSANDSEAGNNVWYDAIIWIPVE